jgi:hypothetical protein
MTLAELPKKKLREQVREAIQLKHYSDRTEETYVRLNNRSRFYEREANRTWLYP